MPDGSKNGPIGTPTVPCMRIQFYYWFIRLILEGKAADRRRSDKGTIAIMGLRLERRSYGIAPYEHGQDVATALEGSLDSDRLDAIIEQVEI